MNPPKEVTPIEQTDGRVRVVVERVSPAVDDGRFPIKPVLGDRVVVEADCFADGHDAVACSLLWRTGGDDAWHSAPMAPLGNDRWRAAFTVDALGSWLYTVRAWVDPFLSWRRDFERRVDPGDLRIAAREAALRIEEAAERADSGADTSLLKAWAQELNRAAAGAGPADELRRIALDEARAAVAARHPDLRHAWVHPRTFGVTVERAKARHSSWYEFFPRSAAGDGARHGTFADCEAWLPYVQRMGFDVLYFPPIHPIGRVNRKGRNNTLDPQAADPGSPWAIGAREGGHHAVLPELGTLEDFRRLVKRAGEHGLEIAMDIAFQCAPDHPWVQEHPQWFRRRADGSIQYAENPPKKYQDIYPFDFESDDWAAMWQALAGVFEFWIGQGVKIFRVDNPHTKSFGFWEWAISTIRGRHPEVIFLSEAFTRPKVMHRLAKLGRSQSYTYFTWRNTKQELTDYFTELTRGPGREYFRPNAWPNTPDILPAALQWGGRAVFMSRVALAATLAANYGIYGPAFELQEARALRAGGEEYLDSEKFELRAWNRDDPASLAGFIATLNRARRDNPALQSDAGLRFIDVDNELLLAYAKATEDLGNIVVCVVKLDPHHVQSGWLQLDLAALGLQPDQAYQMHDLLSGQQLPVAGTAQLRQPRPAAQPGARHAAALAPAPRGKGEPHGALERPGAGVVPRWPEPRTGRRWRGPRSRCPARPRRANRQPAAARGGTVGRHVSSEVDHHEDHTCLRRVALPCCRTGARCLAAAADARHGHPPGRAARRRGIQPCDASNEVRGRISTSTLCFHPRAAQGRLDRTFYTVHNAPDLGAGAQRVLLEVAYGQVTGILLTGSAAGFDKAVAMLEARYGPATQTVAGRVPAQAGAGEAAVSKRWRGDRVTIEALNPFGRADEFTVCWADLAAQAGRDARLARESTRIADKL